MLPIAFHTGTTVYKSLSDLDWDTWNPKDQATLLFVTKDDQILLIRKKRGLGAGKINGPGGRLEPNETARECAIRETHEELRVKARDVAHYGQLDFQFTDGYALRCFVYLALDLDGEPEETEEAIPLWTPTEAIPYDSMWEDDRIWLPLLLQKRKFAGQFIFDDDRMLDHRLVSDIDLMEPA